MHFYNSNKRHNSFAFKFIICDIRCENRNALKGLRFLELKWLEDFVCVAEKGHFARAADKRFITQSALSRRIQALESWVGAQLLDRSQHPIQLTAAGLEFIKFAQELINTSYEGRAVSNKYAKIDASSITIASLHTLTLSYLPELVDDLQKKIGFFSVSVVAETRIARRST